MWLKWQNAGDATRKRVLFEAGKLSGRCVI